MKRIAAIVLISLLSGCSQFAYQALPAHTPIPLGTVAVNLDSSYQLYYRAVISEDQPVSGTNKTQKVLSLYDNTSVSNPGIVGTKNQKIIEIEYLWISARDKTVIYISTVADRYQNRYSNTSLFAGLDHPNAADFRVFLIGKVNDGAPDKFTFYFKDGRHTDNWEVARDGDRLTLLRLAQKRYASYDAGIEVNEAIASGVAFHKQANWQVVFVDKNAKNKAGLDPMAGSSFYYLQNGRKFSIYIPFSKNTLMFKDKYVIYRPDHKSN